MTERPDPLEVGGGGGTPDEGIPVTPGADETGDAPTLGPKDDEVSFDARAVTMQMQTPPPPPSGPINAREGDSWVVDGPAAQAPAWVENQGSPEDADRSWVATTPQPLASLNSSSNVGGLSTISEAKDERPPSSASVSGGATLPDMVAAPSQVGRKLGDFQLEKKIGQGGMGEVFRARQISLERTVAVKVLTRSLAAQPGFMERFQREAKAAANIVHPHVLQIYAFGVDDGTPYFAMEYVEGEDLQQKMRRVKRLPLAEVVDTTIAVASALAAAHEKGMIHRDVKPSNVMIDKQGNVKVMDFGLAKAASSSGDLTQSGIIMGTPNYLSPEQGRGDPIDGRSDLYSLGVVFYEMLSGDLPFRADTPAGLIFKHVYEEPLPVRTKNPDVPPFLEEIARKLLAKDPGERYPDGKALIDDLHEFMDNEEHYMAGGARRAAVSSKSRRGRRVSSSEVETLSEANATQLGPALEKRSGGIATVVEDPVDRNSTTEGISDRLKKVPAQEPEPARPPTVIIRERSGAPVLVMLLALVALGATGWLLHEKGKLREWGLVGSQAELRIAAAQIAFPGVSVRLDSVDGRTRIDLRADQPVDVAPGEYRITVDRPGYEKSTTPVRITEVNGKAVLTLLGGEPFEFKYVPTQVLRRAYDDGRRQLEEGRATLDEGKLSAARQALDVALKLDPDFRPSPEAPTIKALLEESIRLSSDAKSRGEVDRERLGEAQRVREAHDWRALRDLAAKHKGDGAWVAFAREADERLATADETVRQIVAARDRGEHASALDILARLDKEDPRNPESKKLLAAVTQLKEKRDAAFTLAGTATTQAQLIAAREALEKYVKDVPKDELAQKRLEELGEKLRDDLAKPLEDAIKERAWPRAEEGLRNLERAQPQNPRIAAWRGEIEQGKRVDAVAALVGELDRRLLRSPETIADLLDLAAPGMEAEKRALLELGEAGARVKVSRHRVELGRISVKPGGGGHVAKVQSLWDLELEVEGEKVALSRWHELELRLVPAGSTWKFTRFTLLEDKGK